MRLIKRKIFKITMQLFVKLGIAHQGTITTIDGVWNFYTETPI